MENIVYAADYCPYCHMVKQLLRERGVEFEDRVLIDRDEIDEVKDKYNWRTIPIVILGGKFIGGYNETKRFVDNGGLEKKD